MIRDVVKTVFKSLSQPERIEFIVTALQLEEYEDIALSIQKRNSGDLFHVSSTRTKEDFNYGEWIDESD